VFEQPIRQRKSAASKQPLRNVSTVWTTGRARGGQASNQNTRKNIFTEFSGSAVTIEDFSQALDFQSTLNEKSQFQFS